MASLTERETAGPLLWSVKQAAQMLGISTWSCKQLLDADVIPSTKIGARVYVPAEAVRQYVEDLASSSSRSA